MSRLNAQIPKGLSSQSHRDDWHQRRRKQILLVQSQFPVSLASLVRAQTKPPISAVEIVFSSTKTTPPCISEAWLEPVLCALMRQFPFRILGFHSDNGSEFINRIVARLLNKPLIEQTKSRTRHSNDNGLAETKNDAVIRKHMGYGYIPAGHAGRLQQFYTAYFNPYLNYHRPCAQADVTFDEKGRRRCLYRRYQTPLETLLAFPNPAQYLRPGLTPAVLQRIAGTRSDTEAARRMQQAKRRLFASLRPPAKGPWK